MTGINFADLLNEAGADGGDVPDGVYDAQVEQCEAKLASTGKPMVVARFKIISGPHANRVVVNNFVISQGNPNALRFFFQHMAVFGMSRDYFTSLGNNPDALNIVASNMIGRQARLTLGTKDGRQNVNKVEAVPGGATAAQSMVVPQTLAASYPQVQQPVAAQPPIQYTQVAAPAIVQPVTATPQPEPILPSPTVAQEPAPTVQPVVAQQPTATAPPEIPF